MVTRFTLRCPGCDEIFFARLGISATKMTRFYVPCPNCNLPIRGRSYGQDAESHVVEFDAEQVFGDDVPEETSFVTVDPNVPSRYDGAERGEFGTFPAMTLMHLVGDERAPALFAVLPRGRQAVEELWPKVQRIYEYYLVEDWEHFDRAGHATFGDWRVVSTTHERATLAHQAVGMVVAAMTDDLDDSTARFIAGFYLKHTRAIEYGAYVDSARADVGSGLVPALQRSVFDVLDLFIRHYDAWHIGVLRRVIPANRLPLLEGLILFRDEFDTLRDLYQQGFETVCKTLRFALAAQNTVEREHPQAFGDEVPAGVSRRGNPQTLMAYDRMANADRLAYVRQVPGWDGFAGLLNNRTRNAIGHASARHDLRTGLVVSDREPGGVPYLDLSADVFGLFDALGASLQVLRAVRIASSPDFGTDAA